MGSKRERQLQIALVHSDLDDEAAAVNLLRIYEFIFFHNSDNTPFYGDVIQENNTENLT